MNRGKKESSPLDWIVVLGLGTAVIGCVVAAGARSLDIQPLMVDALKVVLVSYAIALLAAPASSIS